MALQLTGEQDRRITETVEREQARLRNFIRRRVADRGDAEDILQEVFYEFVETYRLLKPVEQAGAWLFRVARNRIIDWFRKKRPGSLSSIAGFDDEGEAVGLEELLPSPDDGPDALYARKLLLEEMERAIEELPEEQRDIFIAHEIQGRSFKELAAETGIPLNTLLSRKHNAVLQLRQRLQAVHDEFVKE